MSDEEPPVVNRETAVVPSVLQAPFAFGASVIGPLHVQKGLPCQDACAFEVVSAKYSIIVVADGLGSAAHSERGAAVAVQAALDSLKKGLEDGEPTGELLLGLVGGAVRAARQALEEASVLENCALRDLACTLIVLTATPDSLAVAHIGDGAVVAETDRGLELVSAPADSEYVNEVVPLTSLSWEKALRIAPLVAGVKSVVVLTDGCQRAALKGQGNTLYLTKGFLAADLLCRGSPGY